MLLYIKVVKAPVSRTIFFLENLDLSQSSRPNLKNKNATLLNALIGSIFWNKNILRDR
jgi:hypothetical protein